jgi:hypothetical protein
VASGIRRPAIRLFLRAAGLPIAVRGLLTRSAAAEAVVRRAYARWYWRPGLRDLPFLLAALLTWPAVLVGAAVYFTALNGSAAARRSGRPPLRQFGDHLWLYFSAGVLAPWYYMFELDRDPATAHARSYAYRWETKGGVYHLLKAKRKATSNLANKVRFAQLCRERSIAAAPVLARIRDGCIDWLVEEPDRAVDWMIKPVAGKGGTGIERWDLHGGKRVRQPSGETLDPDALLSHLKRRSATTKLFIQPRLVNHPGLAEINNDALATVRVLSCLNEAGEPEVLGAVMRMAIGGNTVVDNFHAGGIAAAVDLQSGRLGPASNIGKDARLGWLTHHPTSGAPIEGRELPRWRELEPFIVSAHRAVGDRILIGWDVAVTPDGWAVVEANGSPDLDIMQRIPGRGLMTGRFAELLAFHLGDEKRPLRRPE